MADRWQTGDRAKCVNVRDIRLPLRTHIARGGAFLTLGTVYDVRGVGIGWYGQLSLEVGAEHGPKLAERFVKVAAGEESAERLAELAGKVPA